jgi:hypothetical protein
MKTRLTACFVLTFVLCLSVAEADSITFAFEGQITSVDPYLAGAFPEGGTISGYYTFDSTTPDAASSSDNIGLYLDPITAVSFQTEAYTYAGAGEESYIEIYNDDDEFSDTYDVQVEYLIGGTNIGSLKPYFLEVKEICYTLDLLTTDALPLEPPGIVETAGISLVFRDDNNSTNHWVICTLTSLTLAYPTEDMLVELGGDIEEGVALGTIEAQMAVSLMSKINAASAALARDNPNDAKVAMNDLKALINQVEAQTDKKIDPDTADAIIEQANAIIAALGG